MEVTVIYYFSNYVLKVHDKNFGENAFLRFIAFVGSAWFCMMPLIARLRVVNFFLLLVLLDFKVYRYFHRHGQCTDNEREL